jgi:hypothetical protein
MNSSTITVGTAMTATFTFVAGDRDSAADTPNYIVQRYDGTNWNPTTAGAANPLDTTASGITPLIAGDNDFAVGAPLAGVTNILGRFNGFETGTPANSLLGKIQTKIAGVNFGLDIISINAAKRAYGGAVTPVTVQLLDSSDNSGALDANNCRPSWGVVQTLTTTLSIPAAGRVTLAGINVNQAYRDARLRISSGALLGCSTDRFSIRPASLTISALDATWQTAGTARTLSNVAASGGVVHKAATAASTLPFTLRASPQPGTATNYDGSPTVVTGFPACGTLCTTVGTLSFTPGSWVTGSGVRENATVNYSEVGTFDLQLEDTIYADVDTIDGSAAALRTIPATTSAEIGRFVPDHFDLTALITPTFRTFDSVCTSRSFTYIGQPFGYVTAPQATLFARNAAGATTTNYAGTLWKVSGTSNATKDCTTNPDLCVFTTSFTGGGNDSSVVESYAYTLSPASTPNWDNASAVAATAAITPGAGTGTVAISSADTLAFLRSITTPQTNFTANITDTVTVNDASENGIADNGIITTTTPLVFDGGGTGIAFDAGNQFRYGRLRLSNANGSELLNLPIPMQVQYWNGTGFVTNAADNCTTLASGNIKLTAPPAGVSATVGGAFSAGIGSLTLSRPTVPAKVAVDLCADLSGDPGGGTVCVATVADLPYLQGLWAPGASFNNDPTARATFGVYKGANEFIYLRENY